MSEFFIGRQPVFNRVLNTLGYALFFRNTPGLILNAFTETKLQHIVGDKLAFINLTRQFLYDPDLLPIPAEQVVLEVSESILSEADTIDGYHELSNRGFMMALRNPTFGDGFSSVNSKIDFVRIDVSGKDADTVELELDRLETYQCKVIADNIKTHEEYDYLKELGIDYFQGDFFSVPKKVTGKRIPTSKVQILQLLSAVNDPSASIDDLQDLLSQNVSLSIKALNYINSPLSGLSRKIESIQEAIIYLGRDTIRSWITMFAMANIDDKPEELMTMALVRARFCELLAKEAGLEDENAFFTVGMFSILDRLMDTKIEEVLELMSVSDDMKEALVYHKGDRGEALRCVIDLEFDNDRSLKFNTLDSNTIASLYKLGIYWANQSLEFLHS